MRPIGEAGYILTLREFVFLSSVNGATEIYGIVDDTYMLDESEIKKEWERIKSQLEMKQYIEVELDDSIIIDKELHALINTCCEPKAFIKYIVKNTEGRMHSRNYYVGDDIIAELEEDKLMKNKFILTPITSFEKMSSNIKEISSLEDKTLSSSVSFNLPIDEFEKISNYIEENNKDDMASSLKEFECTEELTEDLFYSLKEQKSFLSITKVNLVNKGIQSTNVYSVIEGDEYLWKLDIKTKGDESNINISTCNEEDVFEDVDDIVFIMKDL